MVWPQSPAPCLSSSRITHPLSRHLPLTLACPCLETSGAPPTARPCARCWDLINPQPAPYHPLWTLCASHCSVSNSDLRIRRAPGGESSPSPSLGCVPQESRPLPLLPKPQLPWDGGLPHPHRDQERAAGKVSEQLRAHFTVTRGLPPATPPPCPPAPQARLKTCLPRP